MMGTPGKKLFSGAGKAPERMVFYREGGSFKPQRRAVRSWDDEQGCTLKKTGDHGVAADSGAVPLITAAERGLSTGSSAAIAAAWAGVRRSLPFHGGPPEGRFLGMLFFRRTVSL
jgi:hypothetical protein